MAKSNVMFAAMGGFDADGRSFTSEPESWMPLIISRSEHLTHVISDSTLRSE